AFVSARLRALRASGRFSVRVAIRSSTSTSSTWSVCIGRLQQAVPQLRQDFHVHAGLLGQVALGGAVATPKVLEEGGHGLPRGSEDGPIPVDVDASPLKLGPQLGDL